MGLRFLIPPPDGGVSLVIVGVKGELEMGGDEPDNGDTVVKLLDENTRLLSDMLDGFGLPDTTRNPLSEIAFIFIFSLHHIFKFNSEKLSMISVKEESYLNALRKKFDF